jgi:hypothetical protein
VQLRLYSLIHAATALAVAAIVGCDRPRPAVVSDRAFGMSAAISIDDRFTIRNALLACSGRRPGAVRRVSASVPVARGSARALLCSRAGRRPDRAHVLWPVKWVLRRSGGEEAAESLSAGHAGAVLRNRRVQSRLQVLPELGHLQLPGDRHARRCCVPGGSRLRRESTRLPKCRVHLQRPDDIRGVRHGRGRCLP